jgi:hypothetical protein
MFKTINKLCKNLRNFDGVEPSIPRRLWAGGGSKAGMKSFAQFMQELACQPRASMKIPAQFGHKDADPPSAVKKVAQRI